MRTVQKHLLTVLVWLTSGSALWAGFPQFVCQCAPKTSVSPAGPKDFAPCCCRVSPGAGEENGDGTTPTSTESCCGRKPPKPQKPDQDQGNAPAAKPAGVAKKGMPALDRPTCQRGLLASEPQSFSKADSDSERAPQVTTWFVQHFRSLTLSSRAGAIGHWSQVFDPPPPTDFPTLLQRLTI